MSDDTTDFMALDDKERLRRAERYQHNAYPRGFDWNWRAIRYNRIAMVNHLLRQVPGNPAYLEIGCGANALFDAVPVADKTGVDPVSGGTERMTSDDFFAANTRTFDMIWIDGLHEYHQVHRDLVNALACLRPGGWIALHDMLPVNWKQEHMPRINPGWTGDVWKVAFEVAATPGLGFRIALIDHGVGVLRPAADAAPLADLSGTLSDARFGHLYENIADLPVAPWDQVIAWIEAARTR